MNTIHLMNTITKQKITAILFELDPMGTACVENSNFDEYEAEAEGIEFHHSKGDDLRESIVSVFEYNFWKGCLSPGMVSKIYSELTSINNEEIVSLLTKIFDEVDPISIANDDPNEYQNLAGFTVCNYDDNPEAGIIAAINKSIIELFFDDMILTEKEEKLICQKLTENSLQDLI